jgi:hypothetical protein
VGSGCILPDHPHRRESPDHLLERRKKRSVDLQGKHLGPGLRECNGEGTEACPNFQDPIAGSGPGLSGDEPGEIGIGQEMLAERLSGTDAVPGSEVLKRAPGQQPATTRGGP